MAPDFKNETKPLKEMLSEIGIYIASIIAYTAGLRGLIQYPNFPKTGSMLTVIFTLLALWAWRWSKITCQKPKDAKHDLHITEKPPANFLEYLIDLLRSSSKLTYNMGVRQRRAEILLLTGLTVFSIFQLLPWISEVGMELSGRRCDTVASTGLRVVVAKFVTETGEKFDTNLYKSMGNVLKDVATVCWVETVAKTKEEAIQIGEKQKADIVVWGGYSDNASFQVKITATNWDAIGQEISANNDGVFALQYYGTQQIPFLTQVILSEILYIQGVRAGAITQLDKALIDASKQDWVKESPADLGNIYFFLGYLYEGDTQQSSDNNKAIEAYEEAIKLDARLDRAYFNLASLSLRMKHDADVISNCGVLINKNSFLAPFAYYLRAQSQPTQAASEKDFEEAVKGGVPNMVVSPSRGEIRLKKWQDYKGAVIDLQIAAQINPANKQVLHNLGMAYLLNGDTNLALVTYQTMLSSSNPALTQIDKEVFIGELEKFKTDDNEARNQTIDEIIKMMQAAPPN